jgi:hypothetical protein
MPRAGFEPATPETKRPQTYVLGRAATGIGIIVDYLWIIRIKVTAINFFKNKEEPRY